MNGGSNNRKALSTIKEEIKDAYAQEKINELQNNLLTNRISDYEKGSMKFLCGIVLYG